MIARLRARHRRAWLVVAVALAFILAAALALRPGEIVDEAGLEALDVPSAQGRRVSP